MSDATDFQGRVVLIDGADTPLGAAVARYLAGHGARLALLGDDNERLRALVAELGSVVRDRRAVSDRDDVSDLLASVIDDAGPVDAAFSARGSVIRSWDGSEKPAGVHDVVERDLLRVMLSSRVLVEHFAGRGGGRLVTTAVAAGSFGLRGAATFSAISGAIAGLTRSHALTVRGTGVLVNAVAPILNAPAGGGVVDSSTVYDEARYGAAGVAPVVGYLLSEQCAVSGQVLSVGGGRTARTFAGTAAGFFDAEADHTVIGAHLAEILATDHPIMLEDSRDELLLIEV